MYNEMKIGLDRLNECFELREDGALVSKINRRRVRQGQTVAASPNTRGYLQISVDGVSMVLHRVIFTLANGRFTELEVDHIDRDRRNNHPDNLREVTRSQNMANTGVRKTNTSGHRNVHWVKNLRKWRVQVTHEGQCHEGGLFDDEADANDAANALSIQINGEHSDVLARSETLKEAREIGVGIESARRLNAAVKKN